MKINFSGRYRKLEIGYLMDGDPNLFDKKRRKNHPRLIRTYRYFLVDDDEVLWETKFWWERKSLR